MQNAPLLVLLFCVCQSSQFQDETQPILVCREGICSRHSTDYRRPLRGQCLADGCLLPRLGVALVSMVQLPESTAALLLLRLREVLSSRLPDDGLHFSASVFSYCLLMTQSHTRVCLSEGAWLSPDTVTGLVSFLSSHQWTYWSSLQKRRWS